MQQTANAHECPRYGGSHHEPISGPLTFCLPRSRFWIDKAISCSPTKRGVRRRDRLLAKRRWNYPQECAAALDRGCADGQVVGDGIGKILRREIDEFVAVYACPFDRHHHWFQISVRRARASDAELGAVALHMNVTALQYDHLTGLANRALFEAQAQYVFELACQNDFAAGLALVDLDGFKPVNDEFGHAAGTRCLSSWRGCPR